MKWVITAELHLWWQEKLDFLLVFDTWHDSQSQERFRDMERGREGEERGWRCLMTCTAFITSRWESLWVRCVVIMMTEEAPTSMFECSCRMTPFQLLIWAWLRGRSPKLLWAWDQSWSRQPWMWPLWAVSVVHCSLCHLGLWLVTDPCPRHLIGWGWPLALPRH